MKSTYRSEGYHTSVTHEAQKKIIGCDTWWYDHVQDLPKPTRRLFEQHSGLATHEVLPHIESLVSSSSLKISYEAMIKLVD